MKQAILVFIGGGLGSVLRYWIGKLLNNRMGSAFPWGTFTVNVLGSLLIGVILAYINKKGGISTEWALLLATGFCGGFTTFSSFAYENNMLLKQGDYSTFFLYTASSILLGFFATFVGIFLVKGS